MPFPLIPVAIAAGVSFVVGMLARQPEVNRLKQQVIALQKEVARLNGIIAEQNRQISELKIRYKALKGYAFIQKVKTECDIRGILLHQCAYKEWMELTLTQAHERPISQEELHFYNLYEALLRGGEVSDEQVGEIRSYIYKRYEFELKKMQAPDLEATLRRVGDADAA